MIPLSNGKTYFSLGNNVYSFNIPYLENAERSKTDKICIEHYYSNAEIKTITDHGRIYTKSDFDEFGTSLDKDWSFKGFAANNDLTPISIIAAGNKHLEKKSINAKMSSKNQFAQHVESHADAFNFENFAQIYNIIKEINEET